MLYCSLNGHNQFMLKDRASNTLAVSTSVAKRNILTPASRSHTSQTPQMSVVGVGISV
jgi:hypothetical protein